MDARPANDGQPWTREELILGFELYCRVPFGRIQTRNPLIRELADVIGRTPASVTRKLGNFGAFDPELAARGVSGLTHGSKLDRAIWDEFHRDWNDLVIRAMTSRRNSNLVGKASNHLSNRKARQSASSLSSRDCTSHSSVTPYSAATTLDAA